jgi:DMSO/TMAO reductase YedYZ molybdopterin-dependent catalytic subunit
MPLKRETTPRDNEITTLDPEQACQDAIDAGLLVIRGDPLNGETSIPDLASGAVMANDRFYLRDHFPIPNLDGERYCLSISGLVERPLNVSLSELHNPLSTLAVAAKWQRST